MLGSSMRGSGTVIWFSASCRDLNPLFIQEKTNVMVHGSDGVDITLCVTSIAQVILNPDCRTVRGFEALIEREWLQAGHPFWSRTSKGPFNDSVASKSKIYAPSFILFLDCIWQVRNLIKIFNNFLLMRSFFRYTTNFHALLSSRKSFWWHWRITVTSPILEHSCVTANSREITWVSKNTLSAYGHT